MTNAGPQRGNTGMVGAAPAQKRWSTPRNYRWTELWLLLFPALFMLLGLVAFKFENALKLIDVSNNLGDAKSLITHPATTTHNKVKPEARAAMGINDGMLRLSVGLEDTADICEDLEVALAQL